MSVKVHEPVCLDSAQDLYFWFDHFLGDQLKDEWDSTFVGAGTNVVVDAQTGGIVRLTTGALTNDSCLLDWSDIRSLHVDKKITMELRVKYNDVVNLLTASLILLFNATTKVGFDWWTGFGFSPDWGIIAANGAQTTSDSDVTIDTDYHIYRVECFPTGEVHFYIDGVETANSPITTNIPDDAGDFLQPYLYIQTGADVAISVDIDYCVVRQER